MRQIFPTCLAIIQQRILHMKGIFMNNKRTDVFQVVAMGTYVTSIWLGLMTTIYIDHVRVTHNSAALLLILIFATGFGLFTSSFNFFG